jgi:hypothetical protein
MELGLTYQGPVLAALGPSRIEISLSGGPTMRPSRLRLRTLLILVVAAGIGIGAYVLWRRSAELNRRAAEAESKERIYEKLVMLLDASNMLLGSRLETLEWQRKVEAVERVGLIRWTELNSEKNAVSMELEANQLKSTWYGRMREHQLRLKIMYQIAARRPWLPVPPEPPEPVLPMPE